MAKSPEFLYLPGLGRTEIIPTDMMPLEAQVTKEGEAKTPGGTIGLMMALKAAVPQLSAAEAADLVLAWEAETEIPPRHIRDSHVELASSGLHEKLSGVSAPDIATMITRTEKRDRRSSSGLVVADSSLAETRPEAVLLVEGVFKTVAPTVYVPWLGTQPVIRIDTERMEGRLADLAAYVNRKGIEVSKKALSGQAAWQRNATLILTAGDLELPQYRVDLRMGRRNIAYRGTVPKLG